MTASSDLPPGPANTTRAGPPARGRRGHPGATAAVILTVVVLCVLTTAVMVGKLRKGDYKDAEVWYDAGRRVLAGETLEGLPSYRYPPAFAVMIAPLCALPFPAFFLGWYGTNLALFFVSLRLASHLVSSPADRQGRPPPADCRTRWLAAALVAVLAVDNLFLGQTNILVMALVYWALLEVARNREWRAGLPLAAAIAVKVFPAPLLGYLAYRLRWRAALSTLAWCVLLFLALPAPVRGPARHYRETAAWWQRVVGPYLSRGRAGDWGQHALDFGNQSLQAVAHRYLRRVDAHVMARRPSGPLYVNVAKLSEPQVNAIILGLFAGLAVSFLAACGWEQPAEPLPRAAEHSLAVILLLVVSALSWTYFFVMLLLPALTALELLRERRRLRAFSIWMLRAGLWSLPVATLLLVNASARALGALCWATLLLYSGLAMACWDIRKAPSSSASISHREAATDSLASG